MQKETDVMNKFNFLIIAKMFTVAQHTCHLQTLGGRKLMHDFLFLHKTVIRKKMNSS